MTAVKQHELNDRWNHYLFEVVKNIHYDDEKYILFYALVFPENSPNDIVTKEYDDDEMHFGEFVKLRGAKLDRLYHKLRKKINNKFKFAQKRYVEPEYFEQEGIIGGSISEGEINDERGVAHKFRLEVAIVNKDAFDGKLPTKKEMDFVKNKIIKAINEYENVKEKLSEALDMSRERMKKLADLDDDGAAEELLKLTNKRSNKYDGLYFLETSVLNDLSSDTGPKLYSETQVNIDELYEKVIQIIKKITKGLDHLRFTAHFSPSLNSSNVRDITMRVKVLPVKMTTTSYVGKPVMVLTFTVRKFDMHDKSIHFSKKINNPENIIKKEEIDVIEKEFVKLQHGLGAWIKENISEALDMSRERMKKLADLGDEEKKENLSEGVEEHVGFFARFFTKDDLRSVAEALDADGYSKKNPKDLEVGEKTMCQQSGKFKGVSVGRDKDGWYVFTHRAGSKRYPALNKIPKSAIKKTESTG